MDLLLDGHRLGECDHGCTFCAESTTLAAELVTLVAVGLSPRASRADSDRIEEVIDRMTELGSDHDDVVATAVRDAESMLDAAYEHSLGL